MPIINSSGPTMFRPEEVREGVRNILFGTERSAAVERQLSPDDFPPGTPGISPVNLGISVEDFLTMSREQLEDLQANFAPAIGQAPQLANAPANLGRPVEGQEITALNFTFGETVGRYYRENIKFKPENGYDPDDLESLGNLIEEMTYQWQKKTGRYTRREGGSDYDDEQLRTRNLNSMQHAAAVRDWFYVSYGHAHNLIGSGANQMTRDKLWEIVRRVLGLVDDDRSKFKDKELGGERAALLNIVNNYYGCLIKEIRDAKLLPVLRPTADTQITTFATIRSGG